MGPMIYLNSTELKTIQLGLRMFITQYSADYNLIMAAALISLIPVGALFLSMQRFFIEGVATSGLEDDSVSRNKFTGSHLSNFFKYLAEIVRGHHIQAYWKLHRSGYYPLEEAISLLLFLLLPHNQKRTGASPF